MSEYEKLCIPREQECLTFFMLSVHVIFPFVLFANKTFQQFQHIPFFFFFYLLDLIYNLYDPSVQGK